MYLSVHTPVSLIIGKLIKNPLLSFALAFLAHLVLDSIPHDPIYQNDQIFSIVAGIDIFFMCLVLAILLFKNKLNLNLNTLTAIIGGALPDFLTGINIFTNSKVKILDDFAFFHNQIIHQLFYKPVTLSLFLVIIVQTFFFIFGFLVYFKLIHINKN